MKTTITTDEPETTKSFCWWRWITIYVPLFVLGVVVLYILSDIIMKHLALKTIRSKMACLPEFPTATASPPPALPQVSPGAPMVHVPSHHMPPAATMTQPDGFSSSLHSFVLPPLTRGGNGPRMLNN